MKTPRVSVIIPCYNTAQFVAETLDSVFSQTYSDYEVVVVNDGSPDTPDLERVLGPYLSRIVYVKSDNCGLAGARNNGIRASKGELIALLDSDDAWEPRYLEVQVGKLDSDPSADIVYPNALIFGDSPRAGSLFADSAGSVTFTSLIEQTCVVMVSILARRSALERAGLFDAKLRSCEDFDLWLRCVKAGSRIIYHDEVLVRYRRRKGSLSSDPVWMLGSALKVLVKMRSAVSLNEEERTALESAIRRFEGNKLLHEGKRALAQGDVPAAIQFLLQANLRLKKIRLRMILLLLRLFPSATRTVYRWRSS
ncbi:MAG: glycosyltransferase [Candidatus Sulfotelmatobacter sp.]